MKAIMVLMIFSLRSASPRLSMDEEQKILRWKKHFVTFDNYW